MQINNPPRKLPMPVTVPISWVASRLPSAVVEQAQVNFTINQLFGLASNLWLSR